MGELHLTTTADRCSNGALHGLQTSTPGCLQDTWLLHSVLMLVQSWIEPLIYLQTTLDQYDNAPVILLNKTKWVSEKLISLEQGVVVLIKKVGLINHRVAVRAKKKS